MITKETIQSAATDITNAIDSLEMSLNQTADGTN